MEKPVIAYPIIVEGKYDKIKLDSIFSADVFTTDGFGVFRREDKTAFFRKLSERSPLLILTDSDGAGLVIRNYFHSILPKDRQIHLYTPEVFGKERRKTSRSKAGKLGVEGIDAAILREILLPYTVDSENAAAPTITTKESLTKADLYMLGLSGCAESAVKRRNLSLALGFPSDISASALLTAVNLLYSKQEILSLLESFGYDR